MTYRVAARPAVLAAFLVLAAAPPVSAQDVGETVVKTGSVNEDIYLAGGRVDVQANVRGDVLAAGGSVTVAREVTGDVVVAGGAIRIRGKVGDDVRAAGGTVTVSAAVGDDLVAAGGDVVLSPEARVGGRAWLSGGEVDVGGRVAKGLRASGGTIVVAGEIGGDAQLLGDRIEILPTARIKGNLSYRSPREATIDPGARIGGAITRQPLAMPHGLTAGQRAGAGAVFLLGLMLAGTVLLLALPRFSITAARAVEAEPWRCFGVGLAVLVLTPMVAALSLVSVIGIPLALVVLALYPVALLAGFLTGAVYVADRGLRWLRPAAAPSRGWGLAALAAALIAIGLVRLIPFLGGLAVFVLWLLGLGALMLAAYRTYAATPAGTAARTRERRR